MTAPDADSTCQIGQTAADVSPTSGTHQTNKLAPTVAHRRPDIGQRPNVGLVCPSLYGPQSF